MLVDENCYRKTAKVFRMSGSLRGGISSWQLKTQEARSPVCGDNVLMEIKHGGQVGTKEEYLGSGQESRGPEKAVASEKAGRQEFRGRRGTA